MKPWDDPAVVARLHDGWTTDPRNVADAARLAGIARGFGSESVLDYGCGTGRMAPFFPPDRYLGYDPSAAMVEFARAAHPQYRFGMTLPCSCGGGGDAEVDVAICNSVAQYLPDGERDTMLCDLCRRSMVVLIETYDGPRAQRYGGCDAPIWICPPEDYMGMLAGFGCDVERLVLDGPVDCALALYIARRRGPSGPA